MLEKLQTLEERYNHLERLISDPDAVKDMATWQKNSRTHSKLTEIIMKFREYKACQKTIEDTLELLREKLDGLDAVHLIPPVDHMTMIWMMRRARVATMSPSAVSFPWCLSTSVTPSWRSSLER